MKSRVPIKKSLSLILLTVMMVNVFASSVIAGDVAYIYRIENRVDSNVVDVFEDLGLEVDLVDEKSLPLDFTDYRFIFVGDERFRNENLIPVGEIPSIISNYYFGEEFGLTDSDGISQLAANSPLSVVTDHFVSQVYTTAFFRGSSISVPYYYLTNENKVSGFKRVAGAFSGPKNGDDHILGDVISYAGHGTELVTGQVIDSNICFFGIIESDYWTPAAQEMFEECVGFVGVTCHEDSDCPNMNLGESYCLGDEVYQNVEEFECENPGEFESRCVDDVVSEFVKSCGGTCLIGECVCLDFDDDGYDECTVGDEGDDGRQLDCNDNNSEVSPNSLEMCDNIDNNCNGVVDEGCPTDADNDGYDDADLGDFGDDGLALDCNDNDPTINPGAFEICDGLDNNCDSIVDESCCSDSDSDNYDNCDIGDFGDDGNVLDCSDTDDSVYPGAQEICDAKDNNCNGLVDENGGHCTQGNVCSFGTCVDECVDSDFDGYDDCSVGDGDDDGMQLDCNDNNNGVYPNALEVCDGVDNNCNGLVDENNGHCSEEEVCVIGQCAQVACSDDLDCGEDGLVNGKMCLDGNVYQEYNDYECVNAGMAGSYCDLAVDDVLVDNCVSSEVCLLGSCVDECDDKDFDGYDDCSVGDGDDDGKILDCDDDDNGVYPNALEICDGVDNDCDGQTDEGNGQCGGGSICSFGECVSVSCYDDIDCGVNGFIDGLFCSENGDNVEQNYLTWTCENPGTVSSSCTSDVEPRKVTECNDSCDEGSCVSIVCDSSSDCDDSDNYTKDSCVNAGEITSYCTYEDISCLNNFDCSDGDVNTQDSCVNPGSVSSYCSYDQINCFSNSECGEDGFINDLFCNGNDGGDVYQDYLSWTCENPGTVSSSCTQMVDQREVVECDDACFDGSCVSVVCDGDSDCNDFNSDTIDLCVNPGEVDSFCTHDDIACQSSSDCGIDRFTGGLYCQGDDLFRNFVDYSCNMPGDVDSYCSNDVDGKFIHSCTYSCNEGSCIRCNGDSYCEDGNDNTVDSCKFAGTIDSYCTHETVQCQGDLDCGVDGFSGRTFCRNDNVYQNFRTWMCMNPGDTGSYCDSNQDATLIEACAFGCDDGSCKNEPSECSNELDDDHDGLKDAQDPGCWQDPLNPDSYNPDLDDESRYDVDCKSDDECEFDQALEIYCMDNNVYRDTHGSACENPGTGLSMCVADVSTKLIEICGNNEICTEGECIQVSCNDDNECGDDGFVGDKYCDDNDVYQNFDSNTCVDAGTISSVCTLNTNGVLVESCGDDLVCNGGECIDECVDGDDDGYDSCDSGDQGDDGLPLDCDDNDDLINPGENDDSCNGVDNDCNGLIDEDFVSVASNCGVGECSNNGLIECVNGEVIDSCNPGSPVNEICDLLDNDCDGSIDETDNELCEEDNVCLLGSCVAIACDMNSDCGEDGFVGSDFCSEDDIYQNYREFTCNNAGELSSSCSSLTEPRLKEECSFDCSAGLCVGECNLDSECTDDFYSDDYCTDKNVVKDLHDFSCVDHNCVEDVVVEDVKMCSELCESGECVDIECNSDSECGEDRFEGSTYCQGDDVYQNFKDYSCFNPGTSISMCSDDVDPVLVEACDKGCDNGQCVEPECDNGLDDDGDGLVDEEDHSCWIDPTDSGSYDPSLDDEGKSVLECTDGLDNDDDDTIDELDISCWVDPLDSGSYDPNLDDEGRSHEICDNGLDDDGDGLIDGYVLESLDKTTRGWDCAWNECDNSLANYFINEVSDDLFPLSPYQEGALRDDPATRLRLCQIAGYEKDTDSTYGSYSSPGNNNLIYWDGSKWSVINAAVGGNRGIQTLTCQGKIVECSNGIDDNSNSKWDYCDGSNDATCDPGCADPNDISEEAHDPDCGVIEPPVQCEVEFDNIKFEGSQGPWEHVGAPGDAKAPTLAMSGLNAGETVTAESITGKFSGRISHGIDYLPIACDGGSYPRVPNDVGEDDYAAYGTFTDDNNARVSRHMLSDFKSGIVVPDGATKLYVHVLDAEGVAGNTAYFDNSGNRDSRAPCRVDFELADSSC